MTKFLPYLFLILAIISEVIGTSFIKDTEGFTKWKPTLITALGFALALYMLSFAVKSIPVGVVYAVWSGLGVVLITVIAAYKYHQTPNIPTIIGLGLIVIGVIIVNLVNPASH